MDHDTNSYSDNCSLSSISSYSSSSDSAGAGAFPVADGPQYRQRAYFLRAVKKLGGRRRAFTARCSREQGRSRSDSSAGSSAGTDSGSSAGFSDASAGEDSPIYNRLCVPEEEGLTVDDISRLLCKPVAVGISGSTSIRKSPSQRSRTYRNPTRG
jgi:hypothetical protein